MNRIVLLILTSLLIGFSSCNNNWGVQLQEAGRGDIISVRHLRSITAQKARQMVGDSIEAQFFQYGIDAYRMEYATQYMDFGKKVITTALILVPQNAPEEKLLGYFHGTNMPIPAYGGNMNMPTNYNWDYPKPKSEVTMMGLPFASAGFTVVMPDYIGFGETAGLEHPFVYYPELDMEIIDALLATRKWLGREDRTPVWLTGWSQGGGAALATYRDLQEDYQDEFEVMSSSSLSGPYDFTRFLTSVLQHPDSTYLLINLYIWAGYVVNYFGTQRPNDQIFTAPITDEAAAILGSWGKPGEIFRPIFIDGILKGRDSAYINTCNRNSTARGWKPQAKVYLHHGADDWVVPPFNSQSAYDGLKAEGADVTLYLHKGYTHFNCCWKYTNTTLHDWLDPK